MSPDVFDTLADIKRMMSDIVTERNSLRAENEQLKGERDVAVTEAGEHWQKLGIMAMDLEDARHPYGKPTITQDRTSWVVEVGRKKLYYPLECGRDGIESLTESHCAGLAAKALRDHLQEKFTSRHSLRDYVQEAMDGLENADTPLYPELSKAHRVIVAALEAGVFDNLGVTDD